MLIRSSAFPPTTRDTNSPDVEVVLVPDNWNDWFKWKTMFSVFVLTGDGNHHELGSVKIAERTAVGTEDAPYRPSIPESGLTALGADYLSLGQDENYYSTLKSMPDKYRESYLIGMRDCAFDTNIYRECQTQPVLIESLTRYVTEHSILGRYNRLANGNASLTKYYFKYNLPVGFPILGEVIPLEFAVVPDAMPPSNMHVLIGRNAVGKTRALNLMSKALTTDEPEEIVGSFEYGVVETKDEIFPSLTEKSPTTTFSALLSVSFSAFDKFGAHPSVRDGLTYHYVGLKSVASDGLEQSRPKTPTELAVEFARSAASCRVGKRLQAWNKALTTLKSDPLFEELNLDALSRSFSSADHDDADFFLELSSGHAIVLLIVTRLVELVEEQTLVLLDEPETHLHPPLLSAFIRAISAHLMDRNGVAIIATHSPVVLQEVPSSCVYKITRSGNSIKIERPETETFGENVGTLTREIFGLEVTKSGFHKMIENEISLSPKNYDLIISKFQGKLGAEARSILRILLSQEN